MTCLMTEVISQSVSLVNMSQDIKQIIQQQRQLKFGSPSNLKSLIAQAREARMAQMTPSQRAVETGGTFGSRLREIGQRRGEQVVQSIESQRRGEQTPGETAFQTIGQVAGGAAETIFSGITSAFRALPDVIEDPIRKAGGAALESAVGQKFAQSVQGFQQAFEEFEKENPRAARNLRATAGIAELLPVEKAVGLGVRAAKPITQAGLKVGEEALGQTGKLTKKTGKALIQETTGLSQDALEQIVRNPEAFTKKSIADFDRVNVANRVKETIDKRLDDLSGLGKEYNKLRQSAQVVELPEGGIFKRLKDKYNIEFDDAGKIIRTAKTKPLSTGDAIAIEDFARIFGNEKFLDVEEFLNARSSLSTLSKFDTAKTTASTQIAKDLRAFYDEAGKRQIKGLKEIDTQFAPEIKLMNQIKKDFLKPDGELKDNAISKIANLTGKGKEKTLERLEKIAPGIGEQIKILKALEDIEYSKGRTVGAYTRGMIRGGAIITGNVPAIVVAIATAPQVVVPLLREFGRLRIVTRQFIDKIISKLKRGVKLTKEESDVVEQAIKNKITKANEKLTEVNKKFGDKAGLSIKEVDNAQLLSQAKKAIAEGKSVDEFIESQKPSLKMINENLKEIDIKDLFAHGESELKDAIKNVESGALSKTSTPIEITQLPTGEVVVLDGQHRVVQAIKNGKSKIDVDIIPYEDAINPEFGYTIRPLIEDIIQRGDFEGVPFQTKQQLTDIYNKAKGRQIKIKRLKK